MRVASHSPQKSFLKSDFSTAIWSVANVDLAVDVVDEDHDRFKLNFLSSFAFGSVLPFVLALFGCSGTFEQRH